MYELSKSLFDFVSSLLVLLLLFPFLLIISCIVLFSSRGGIFYRQDRVGKDGIIFKILKFRSMKVNSDKKGQLTIGDDERVTGIGRFLRKSKLDEVPQLLNVLAGHMSVVGPRPEVRKYVHLYNKEQLKVISVKPGLTDLASIEYFDEQDELGKAEDPEKQYVEVIMPRKLELNLKYLEKRSFLYDLGLIFKTFAKILF
jgi:lipopolysaccharide/colanic/teichoic acid biosynthesis glycosyltransferase